MPIVVYYPDFAFNTEAMGGYYDGIQLCPDWDSAEAICAGDPTKLTVAVNERSADCIKKAMAAQGIGDDEVLILNEDCFAPVLKLTSCFRPEELARARAHIQARRG